MPKVFSRAVAFLPFILILALSFFTWKPLLNKGYFSMHDDQQVVRLQQLDKSLQAGQFPVRWVEDLGFGYGYPLFNFYPPLSYYLGEFYHLAGLGYINSIKLVWFTALLGSALAMYLFAREFLGKVGGTVAALFYLYAPYHAVDAYVRGALAELFSFVWLPLILLAVYKKRPILAGILLALLMVTHNLIFLPFMAFFAFWALVFDRKSLVISPILAFGLTAFFWLPALAEKPFTLVDQLLIKNLAAYQIHFLCPFQLWYGLWGFGGSVAGCADGLSFALGKIYWLVILLSVFSVIIFRNKKVLLVLGLLVFSLFMTAEYSRFLWDHISQLWYLQFPWRFLEFAVLFSALLAGFVGKRVWTAAVLICLLLFIQAKYFVPQKYYPDMTDASLLTPEYVGWDISSSSFEFMPRGVATYINDKGVVWVDINQAEIPNSKFKIKNGNLNVNYWKPDGFSVTGEFRNGASFQPQITNFPGWKVWVDGKEVPINDNNKYKLITVDVWPGNHEITGKFTNTPVRTIGNIISSLAIVILGGYLWMRRK